MTRADIHTAIGKERDRQDDRYDWTDYTDYHRSSVLAAQAGKAVDSALPSGCHPRSELRRRLVQTAAVAVRWLEGLEHEQIHTPTETPGHVAPAAQSGYAEDDTDLRTKIADLARELEGARRVAENQRRIANERTDERDEALREVERLEAEGEDAKPGE